MNRPRPQPPAAAHNASQGTSDAPEAPGTTDATAHAKDARTGLILGITAYLMWGALPMYFPLLKPAAPMEIIAHRIVWSCLFCLIALAVSRGLGSFWRILRTPRLAAILTLAAVLVATNWSVYVYGVMNDHVLDAALGYFINPLVTVALAVVFLSERLRPVQWVALGIGVAAVVVIATDVGGLPWIALALAFSFGLYGLVKSKVGREVNALPGTAVETAVLTPVALIYLIWLGVHGQATFGSSVSHSLLLASTGVVTALPLLLFSGAARRLPLSVVGMLQYMAPVLQFLCGLLVFHERMSAQRWAGFILVWVALVILTVDGLRAARATRLASRATQRAR